MLSTAFPKERLKVISVLAERLDVLLHGFEEGLGPSYVDDGVS